MKFILIFLFTAISATAADYLIAFDIPADAEISGAEVYARRASEPSFVLVKTVLDGSYDQNAAGYKGALISFDKPGSWSVYIVLFYDHTNSDGSVTRLKGPMPDPENVLTFTIPGSAFNLKVVSP